LTFLSFVSFTLFSMVFPMISANCFVFLSFFFFVLDLFSFSHPAVFATGGFCPEGWFFFLAVTVFVFSFFWVPSRIPHSDTLSHPIDHCRFFVTRFAVCFLFTPTPLFSVFGFSLFYTHSLSFFFSVVPFFATASLFSIPLAWSRQHPLNWMTLSLFSPCSAAPRRPFTARELFGVLFCCQSNVDYAFPPFREGNFLFFSVAVPPGRPPLSRTLEFFRPATLFFLPNIFRRFLPQLVPFALHWSRRPFFGPPPQMVFFFTALALSHWPF